MEKHVANPEAIKVLDQGFVRLVDAMGDDAAIVQAARVSYGAGTKTVREDARLINYLMKHDHTSPFEMVEFKFHIKAPMFIARQWLRHRTASVNEVSARYSEVPDEHWLPTEDQLRGQGSGNRQVGSGDLPGDTAWAAAGVMGQAMQNAYEDYRNLLTSGVCREQARAVLPVAMYTEWYWKIDLHNLLRFLRLRLDAHAQQEIRVYAEVILGLVREVTPATVEAWEEHVLHAKRLSRADVARMDKELSEAMSAATQFEYLMRKMYDAILAHRAMTVIGKQEEANALLWSHLEE